MWTSPSPRSKVALEINDYEGNVDKKSRAISASAFALEYWEYLLLS